jgi:hypothetical protein
LKSGGLRLAQPGRATCNIRPLGAIPNTDQSRIYTVVGKTLTLHKDSSYNSMVKRKAQPQRIGPTPS